jgi:SAM-dependent methyltransferase
MTTDAAAPASLYDTIAPFYDDWQQADGMTPFSHLVLDKLGRLLAWSLRGGPIPSFVDIGCATGELVLGLRRLHPTWRLAGIDASAGMLDVARRKPGAGGIDWINARLGDPLAPPRFDAAGCFYDTLNHLPDPAALDAALASIAAALVPGGLFIFDVTNELGFDQWWRGRNLWRGPDWSLAIQTHYDGARGIGEAEIIVEHGRSRATAALVESCFSAAQLTAALDRAGLDALTAEPWSPFAIDAPGKTWWISRKRHD